MKSRQARQARQGCNIGRKRQFTIHNSQFKIIQKGCNIGKKRQFKIQNSRKFRQGWQIGRIYFPANSANVLLQH
jgi:hypothetical protein